MRKIFFLACLLLFLASPALAQEEDASAPGDGLTVVTPEDTDNVELEGGKISVTPVEDCFEKIGAAAARELRLHATFPHLACEQKLAEMEKQAAMEARKKAQEAAAKQKDTDKEKEPASSKRDAPVVSSGGVAEE
jgi:hypothetical protein